MVGLVLDVPLHIFFILVGFKNANAHLAKSVQCANP
jgi:hypothetical protein